MSGIAGYKLVRAIRLGPYNSSFLAIAPGTSDPGVVVERCHPVAECDVGRSDDALGLFLERRVLQRRWVEQIGESPGGLGNGHVVAVRDLGVTETEGYAVRDRYDLSVDDLIRAKVKLRSDVLLELVSGIVSGLRAIERAAGRPHGDLTADAVLLADLRPGRMRVGLRNPLPSRMLGSDLDSARRDELRLLGLMIYELVVHRRFRELGGYPVRNGPEWRSLGPDHGFWLGLVNDLLDPKSSVISLDEISARLDGLKLRKPGPGRAAIGGWVAAAVVVLVGIGAFVVMPRGEGGGLAAADFKLSEFERWCRVSPGVQALREKIRDMDGQAPGVLKTAEEILAGDVSALSGFDGLQDYFDPNHAIEVTGYITRLGMRGRTEGLGERVAHIKKFHAAVADQTYISDPTAKNEALKQIASLYTAAHKLLDGDESVGNLGLAGLFSEHWPARDVVESVSRSWSDRPGWGRAGELISEQLENVDDAVRVICEGVPFSQTGEETGRIEAGPVQGELLASVESLVSSVLKVEALAVELAEVDERIDEMEALSGELAAHAVLAGLAEELGRELGADPLLESLPALFDLIGVLDEGEGIDVLIGRLARAEKVLGEIEQIVKERWLELDVDVIAMRSKLGDQFTKMREQVDSSEDPSVLSAWVDERIGLCGAWVEQAAGARAYPESERPGNRLAPGAERDDLERLWREALDADRKRCVELEGLLLQAEGESSSVEELLVLFGEAVSRVRTGPDWPSREREILADVELANRLGGVLDRVITEIHDDVLKKPSELIADWRAGRTLESPGLLEALDRLVSLREVRESVVGGMIDDWQKWSEQSQLGADEATKHPESKAFRARLKAFEQVIGRSVLRVLDIPPEMQRVGGFNWSAIEPAVLAARSDAIAGVLRDAGELWDAAGAGAEGGEIDLRTIAALAGAGAELERLNRDLESLASLRAGLDRCELPGFAGMPGVDEVAGLLESLGGRLGGYVEQSEDVRSVLAVVGELLGVFELDDMGELLERAVETGGEGPDRAVRYALLLRADELARSGAAWPIDVGSMRSEAARLRSGLEALRSELDDSPGAWVAVSDRLVGVLSGWWVRGFDVAGSEADLGVLVDEAPGWFEALGEDWSGYADVGLLDGALRYNAEAYRTRSAILADARDTLRLSDGAGEVEVSRYEESLKARTSARIKALRELGRVYLADGVRQRVFVWLDEVERAIAEAKSGKAGWDEHDYGPVGAGLSGWRAEQGESADGTPFVTYTNGTVSMTFYLLELASGEQVFLAEDEFSVGMLKAVSGALDAEEHSSLMDWLDEIRLNKPEGPLAQSVRWLRSRGLRVEVSAYWLNEDNLQYGDAIRVKSYPAYPESLVDPTDPVGISPEQGKPSLEHPVSYVTYKAAKTIAELIGCRLPTVAEFERALEVQTYPPESGVWNLRDEQTYPAQRENFRRAMQYEVVSQYQAGTGCYDFRVREGDDEQVWEYHPLGTRQTDSKLWFEKTGPVASQRGIRFRHIIGNVAEFVLSENGFSAMGASALSHPSVRPERVVGGLSGVAGYADVGFRLAIDADDFGSLAKSILNLVSDSAGDVFVFGGG